jgi:hypothetical protein
MKAFLLSLIGALNPIWKFFDCSKPHDGLFGSTKAGE